MITVLPRPTWLRFISFNPVIWPSVLVCHSDYEDMIAFHRIEKLVWKFFDLIISHNDGLHHQALAWRILKK